MQKINVNVCPMYADVIVPSYQTLLSAGCDVRAYLADKTKFPDGKIVLVPGFMPVLIPTGLKFSVPDGYEMQIRPRSGMSVKTKARIANSPGTLDADYRGELMIIFESVALPNYADNIVINHQDRIAQLVFAPIVQAEFTQMLVLDETNRGSGGFGSTGNT